MCTKFFRELWIFTVQKNLKIKLRNWGLTATELALPLFLLSTNLLDTDFETDPYEYKSALLKYLHDINTQ